MSILAGIYRPEGKAMEENEFDESLRCYGSLHFRWSLCSRQWSDRNGIPAFLHS